MNELRRLAYLDALGIDSYVSRRVLPGAAPTQRLVVVPRAPATPATQSLPEARVSASVDVRAQLQAENAEASKPVRRAATQASMPKSTTVAPVVSVQTPFSLAAIVVSDCLWVEALQEGLLASDQVQLIAAMGRALTLVNPHRAKAPNEPRVAQFDWPMHNNQQLDNSAEAARASASAFLGRKIQEYQCRGLVLLGKRCEQWLDTGIIDGRGLSVVRTNSTQEMLVNSLQKAQVWRDLLPLRTPPVNESR